MRPDALLQAEACDLPHIDMENLGNTQNGTGPTPATRPASSRMSNLAQTIESDLIPKLLAMHGSGSAASRDSRTGRALSGRPLDDFVARLLAESNVGAAAFVDLERDRGVPFEAILLELMAPAARRLGEMWAADECSFIDVTLAMSRLHQLLRRMEHGRRALGPSARPDRRVLLVPTPGEQHTFGLRIVEEFMIRDAWDVESHLTSTESGIVSLVSTQPFRIVGLSLSGETLINGLTSAIRGIRDRSLSRNVLVMVGGALFSERPELVSAVGADIVASDAADAVRKAAAV